MSLKRPLAVPAPHLRFYRQWPYGHDYLPHKYKDGTPEVARLAPRLTVFFQFWRGLAALAQTGQNPLGIVATKHVLRLAFDTGDDRQ